MKLSNCYKIVLLQHTLCIMYIRIFLQTSGIKCLWGEAHTEIENDRHSESYHIYTKYVGWELSHKQCANCSQESSNCKIYVVEELSYQQITEPLYILVLSISSYTHAPYNEKVLV